MRDQGPELRPFGELAGIEHVAEIALTCGDAKLPEQTD